MEPGCPVSYIRTKLLLMAKQCGPFPHTGTIDNVCFYKMEGIYYARMKSSLTRKRVLREATFLKTRIHAATFGEASQIASLVYELIPKVQKGPCLYREMTGKAIYLLREGKDKEAVFQNLYKLNLSTKNELQGNQISEVNTGNMVVKVKDRENIHRPALSALILNLPDGEVKLLPRRNKRLRTREPSKNDRISNPYFSQSISGFWQKTGIAPPVLVPTQVCSLWKQSDDG